MPYNIFRYAFSNMIIATMIDVRIRGSLSSKDTTVFNQRGLCVPCT